MAAYLVTLQEALDALRIPNQPLIEAQVQGLLDSAESWVAQYTGTQFIVAERTDTVNAYPYDSGGLRLRARPLVAVSKVSDVWTNEDFLSSDYYVVNSSAGPRLFWGPPSNQPFWPQGLNRYVVTYTAGYNDGNTPTKPAGSVPAPAMFKTVIMQLVIRAYQGRGSQSSQGMGRGLTIVWDKLMESDIALMLDPWVQRELV